MKSDAPLIERFFYFHWNKWIAKARWVLLGLILIWIGLAIWRVSMLEPATEALQMLNDDHELMKLQNSMRSEYHTGEYDNTIKVRFLWGVKGIDRKGVGQWDSSDFGQIIWDNDFDMSSEANQQRILTICNELKTHKLVKDQQVTCWVKDFVDAQNGGNPVPQASFYTQLANYLKTTNGQNQYNDNQIGYIDGKLYFMTIEALATPKPFQGYEKLYPVYEDWEDLKDNYNKASPKGVNNAIQTAGIHWAFLITEKEFVDGAVQGIMISMAFAFAVLLLSTLNIVVSIYAILSIGGIVISAIAIMQMAGWTLGIVESIAVVILIGFSVDYVVHLANHYVESVYIDRFRRMQDALGGIGISIVSGAITTLGCGFFLFFAQIVFFQKFAVLITTTICFSLFFALVFFTAINHIIGAQGKCGDLKYYIVDPLMRKIKTWWRSCTNKGTKDEEGESKPKEDQENPVSPDIKLADISAR